MKIKELKTILTNSSNLNGWFNDKDIDYFIKNLSDEKNYEYVKINGVIIPFRRICIGQNLSKELENTYLLFIYDFKQIQIQIKDIETIEFNPEFIIC